MGKVRHYENGQWSEGDDRLSRAIDALPDGADFLPALHLSIVVNLGYGEGPLFTLWGHDLGWTGTVDLPPYVIDMTGEDGSYEYVTAGARADAMDLMGRWAPIVTASLASQKAGYRP